MNTLKYVIIGIIILLALLFLYDKQENITSTDSGKTLSDEALQYIASVYNTQNMILTNLKVTSSFNLLPRGCIIAFNDKKAPDGWALCDGAEYTAPNGDKVKTPDLRGRFIRMSYTMTGANGGDIDGDNLPINIADAHAIPLNSWSRDNVSPAYTKMQNHSFGETGGTDWRQQGVSELANHKHYTIDSKIGPNINQYFGFANTVYSGGGGDLLGGDGGDLSKRFVTSEAGQNFGMGIMPPYYVLTYIMKL